MRHRSSDAPNAGEQTSSRRRSRAIGSRLRATGSHLRTELVALSLAYRDPRTPWYARVVAVSVVAYALSPLDLIPDPIPVLGYLDDLVLVPLGIALALRLIPPTVMTEARARAREAGQPRGPAGWLAAGAIVALWLLLAALAILLVIRFV